MNAFLRVRCTPSTVSGGNPELSHIPVVFLTGRTGMHDAVAGLRAGAHDYLKKPFEPEELLARVGSALHVKQLQDQLRDRNAALAGAVCVAERIHPSRLRRHPVGAST